MNLIRNGFSAVRRSGFFSGAGPFNRQTTGGGGSAPAPPDSFTILLGGDGAILTGADGAYLIGVA